jgi:5-methylcytosine-specific restriction protein B
MEHTDQERIIDAWEAFADAGFTYVSDSGERRSRTEVRDDRHEQLAIRQELLNDFLEEQTDLTTFKRRMNEECASNKLWGFSGFSGMMFFNMLESASEVDDETELSTLLREILAPPDSHDTARSRLQHLIEYVNQLRAALDESQSAPAVGHVPYFVSYFWQLHDPDTYPIYYSSMRDALANLEIWTPSGDHPSDYAEFWELNEEIRDVLESHTGEHIHLWDIERLCLFWLNRDAVSSRCVWIEKAKPTEWNYGDPGSGFTYGEALWAPQENKDGQQIYERLREPAIGDVVLHLSREDDAIVGTSVIESDLQTDFEIPEDAEWTAEQRETGGYLRELKDYRDLTPPFSVREELLEVEQLEPSLRRIAEDNSVFYTESLTFTPQAYITEAPQELVEILARQSESLRDRLSELGYDIDGTTPAGEYETISEATDDVRARLDGQEGDETNLLNDAITTALIEEWTTMLSGFEPNSEVSPADDVRGKQILQLYEDTQEQFKEQAAALGVGELPQLTPAETLFIVSFRELQSVADATVNFNQVKYNVLRNEAYTVRQPIISDPPEGEPLEPAPAPDRGEQIRELITDFGQLVFYGPPGTGKTYTAQRFARWWLTEACASPHQEQLETVTFHPSFSYEDFIEGLTARKTDDGDVAYEIEAGVFKRIAERAREAYQESPDDPSPYVLIIDEINRGNLAQIFGETITGLERDKRLGADNEARISLAHSRRSFTVPPNLYVIGTMNTADRSIALVDAALRRRFRFISFPPNYEALAHSHGFSSMDAVEKSAMTDDDQYQRLLSLSILAIRKLNNRILDAPDLGKGKQIGHSFLWDVGTESDLCTVWQFEILPLLEEYYFGQFERIREELFRGSGDELYDFEREEVREITPSRLTDGLTAIVNLDTTMVSTDTESGTD